MTDWWSQSNHANDNENYDLCLCNHLKENNHFAKIALFFANKGWYIFN